MWRRLRWLVVLLFLVACGSDDSVGPREVDVEGEVALGALMALGDGHLQQIADHFRMLAMSEEARSAQWDRVRVPLGAVERLTVNGLMWFALPDGSYWSIPEGKAAANLSDRGYWPRLMARQAVIGDLVVSRATGRSVAIVAVPVIGASGDVVGVLGSSVYLDSLSQRIRREMGLHANEVFYAIDSTPMAALHMDPTMIFTHPLELGEPDLERAITEMLGSDDGVVTYTFRGTHRTMLYRRSPVTRWWYAFGKVW